MGERLLLAIRERGDLRPVWLYHHWGGAEATFLSIILETWVKDKPKTKTDWVKGLLIHNEGMEVADWNWDKNYLAALFVEGKQTVVVWVPLDWRNFGHNYEIRFRRERQFIDNFIRGAENEHYYDAKSEVIELATVQNYSIVYLLDQDDPNSTKVLIDRVKALRQEQINRLEKMRQNYTGAKPDYIEDYLKALKDAYNELVELEKDLMKGKGEGVPNEAT